MPESAIQNRPPRGRAAVDADQLARQRADDLAGGPVQPSAWPIPYLQFAFHTGEPLTNDHLVAAIPEVRPLAKTDLEAVTEITHWLDAHTKPAGDVRSQASNDTPKRRRVNLN